MRGPCNSGVKGIIRKVKFWDESLTNSQNQSHIVRDTAFKGMEDVKWLQELALSIEP